MLKAVYACGDKQAEAMKIERFLKNQKSRKLIEKLIAGGAFTGILGEFADIDHLIPAQTDHRFRGKLTT